MDTVTIIDKMLALHQQANLSYNGYILLALLFGIPILWCLFKLRSPEVRKAVGMWILNQTITVAVLYGLWKFASTIGWSGALEITMALTDKTRDEASGFLMAIGVFGFFFISYIRAGLIATTVANYQIGKAKVFEKTGKLI